MEKLFLRTIKLEIFFGAGAFLRKIKFSPKISLFPPLKINNSVHWRKQMFGFFLPKNVTQKKTFYPFSLKKKSEHLSGKIICVTCLKIIYIHLFPAPPLQYDTYSK